MLLRDCDTQFSVFEDLYDGDERTNDQSRERLIDGELSEKLIDK